MTVNHIPFLPSRFEVAALKVTLHQIAHGHLKADYEELRPQLSLVEDDAHGCLQAGLAAQVLGHPHEAVKWFKRSTDLNPNHVGALYRLGAKLIELDFDQASIAYLNRVVKLQPDHYKAWAALAKALYARDRIDLALAAALRAYALKPTLRSIKPLIANAYHAKGKIEEAKRWMRLAYEEAPDTPLILSNYVTIFAGAVSDEFLLHLEALLAQTIDSNSQSILGFSAAQILEKRGDIERAFDYYEIANTAKLKAMQARFFESPRSLFDRVKQAVANWPDQDLSRFGISDAGMILVVGMPRSGTTLVQQILGAHSCVTGAGELRALEAIMIDGQSKRTGAAFPQSANLLSPEDSRALAHSYWHTLKSFGNTPFVVDKMPANFIFIPFIWRMMPKAKLVHLQRDAIDVCWSLWRTSFMGEIDYAYHFEWMAEYYAAYHEQMAFYRAHFGSFIHDVSYEDLIKTPEVEMRRLLEFCGLEWEQDVTKFHLQKQSIRTASINQAHLPIYHSSLRSWEPVKHRMKPLIEALHARGIETCVSRGEVNLD